MNPKSSDIEINGEETYLRLLAMNAFKKVFNDRLMSFENVPVELSICRDDGLMMPKKKSDFMQKLQ